ncbi:hypothetical protein [Oceaniglobus indicus]|nr:hypothetical protein [Oceaniglobus indicus]
MRYRASGTLEITRLVEGSHLLTERTQRVGIVTTTSPAYVRVSFFLPWV